VIERVEGPTPRGGAYSVWAYRDGSSRDVPKEQATVVLVSEYDAEDNWLGESVIRQGEEK
jgi:hypothetical protein